MAYSSFFDENGKLVKFKNDGDYNAYKAKKGQWFYTKREEIENYADAFQIKNMTEERKQEFDQEMRTDAKQMDLYKMYLASDNGGKTFWSVVKSWFTDTPASKYAGMDFKERLTNIIQNDTLAKYSLRTKEGERLSLKANTRIDILNALITRGGNDFELNYVYNNALWHNIVANNDYSKDVAYPTQAILGSMDVNIDYSREYLSSILLGEARVSNGCSSDNCGDVGAGREGGARPHYGVDILAEMGAWVIAGTTGTLTNTTSPDLPGINIQSEDGHVLQTLYVESMLYDTNKKNEKIPMEKIQVKQGGVIGRVVDITVAPQYKDTINHAHVEILDYNYHGYVENKDTKEVTIGRSKQKVYDANKILFPDHPSPYGNDKVNEFIKKRQVQLKQLYEQQHNK